MKSITYKYTYRWMEGKDLKHFDKNVLKFVKNPKNITYVVEDENNFVGIVVYNLQKKKINIINIGYENDEIFCLIINEISSKFEDKDIVMEVCQYDLGAHLLLKKMGFKAVSIEKEEGNDFYVFIKKGNHQ